MQHDHSTPLRRTVENRLLPIAQGKSQEEKSLRLRTNDALDFTKKSASKYWTPILVSNFYEDT